MCSICGGAACAGTGGCQAAAQAAKLVVQNPQPAVQITITYAQASYAWIHSLFAAFFAVFQDVGRNSKDVVRTFFERYHCL